MNPGPARDDAATSGDHSGQPLESRHYQLTHDYLVPSLRSWLTRKRKETNQGRAELLLAERAAWWSGQRDVRLLPTTFGMGSISGAGRGGIDGAHAEQQMMRRADRHVLLRTLLVAVVLLAGIGIWRWIVASNRSRDAEALLAVLPDAQIAQIPGMIDDVRRSDDARPLSGTPPRPKTPEIGSTRLGTRGVPTRATGSGTWTRSS